MSGGKPLPPMGAWIGATVSTRSDGSGLGLEEAMGKRRNSLRACVAVSPQDGYNGLDMAAELSVELPRTAEAAFLARRALGELDGRIDARILPDVRLLVSELITNSVKYGGD